MPEAARAGGSPVDHQRMTAGACIMSSDPDRSPRRTVLALTVLPALLAGCAETGDGSAVSLPALSLSSLPSWGGDETATPDTRQIQRQIAEAIWGVVPEAPAAEADRPPAPIRGSAIAVSPETLLTSCEAAGQRGAVGLLRRSGYRVARVVAADRDRRVCVLQPPEADLRPVRAWRSFDDLRVGEPVLAAVSRTSREFVLARGALTAKGGAADPFLETTLSLPTGTLSAALFDASGHLIGFGSAGPGEDSVMLAAPLQATLVPRLARADSGRSAILPVASRP
jgi:hypothetical protein